MIIFNVLCLLYVLSTATVVCDFLSVIQVYLDVLVSNNYIYICNLRNIVFLSVTAGCTITSAWNWYGVNVISPSACPSHSKQLLWPDCKIYLGTHKPLHLSCHPIYSHKSSKIYRCWIVWGKNIYVVIIPSFLAITFIGQSIYLHLINRF